MSDLAIFFVSDGWLIGAQVSENGGDEDVQVSGAKAKSVYPL